MHWLCGPEVYNSQYTMRVIFKWNYLIILDSWLLLFGDTDTDAWDKGTRIINTSLNR